MQQASLRHGAARASAATRGHSLGAERAPRMVRGYDQAGKVLFSAPAAKVERPSARKAMDGNTVRAKHATFGTRLVRVEVDNRSGEPTTFVVTPEGAVRECVMLKGRIAMILN